LKMSFLREAACVCTRKWHVVLCHIAKRQLQATHAPQHAITMYLAQASKQQQVQVDCALLVGLPFSQHEGDCRNESGQSEREDPGTS